MKESPRKRAFSSFQTQQHLYHRCVIVYVQVHKLLWHELAVILAHTEQRLDLRIVLVAEHNPTLDLIERFYG